MTPSSPLFTKACLAVFCSLTFSMSAVCQPMDWASLNREVEKLSTQGQHQEALVAAQRLVAATDRSLPPLSIEQVLSLSRLGLAYRSVGQPVAAEPYLRRAIAVAERMAPQPPAQLRAVIVGGIAAVCAEQGRLEEAEKLYKSALASMEPPDPPYIPTTIRLRQELGSLYLRLRNPALAETLLRSTVQAAQGRPEENSMEVARAWADLGIIEASRQNARSAQENSGRALRIAQSLGPKGVHLVASIQADQSDLAQKQGALAEALALQAESLSTLKKAGSAPPAIMALTHARLARLQLLSGQPEEALASATQAEAIYAQHFAASVQRRAPLLTMEEAQLALKRRLEASATRAKIHWLDDLIEAQRADPFVRAPIPRIQPQPDYPALAKRGEQQGTAVVRVRVSEQGVVQAAQLVASTGYRLLDEAAMAAALKGEYEPAKSAVGKAVPATMSLPIRFVLE